MPPKTPDAAQNKEQRRSIGPPSEERRKPGTKPKIRRRALPTEPGKVPSSRIRHRQPHLPNRLLHPEFAELALLEGEDDLDGCLYFDWLVVEHIRAIAPGF